MLPIVSAPESVEDTGVKEAVQVWKREVEEGSLTCKAVRLTAVGLELQSWGLE